MVDLPSNTRLLLDGLIEERKKRLAPDMNNDDFFELFSVTELLKPYDLDIDEIASGIVDGGGDGGIDAIFFLIDGVPLETALTPRRQHHEYNVDIVVIQCKNTDSFSGTAIDKLTSSTAAIFDLSRSIAQLKKVYNERLVQKIDSWRKFYVSNIPNIDDLNVRYYYFSKAEHIHEAPSTQVETFKSSMARLFPNSELTFRLIGAQELLRLARTPSAEWIELSIKEGPLKVVPY